jgi:hypothetical protein
MPYIYEWVEPDLFLEHKEVEVYHSYRNDDYGNGPWEYWFQVQLTDDTEGTTEDDMHEFDVRDLDAWKVISRRCRVEPKQAIRKAIDKGGRQELLKPVPNRCRFCREIPEDCECAAGRIAHERTL